MKKAKVLLTAVVVLATVGGALAFKVRSNQSLFCSHPIDGQCKVLVTGIRTTDAGKLYNCTNVNTTAVCPQITVTAGA
jgi:hypothetical protein